VQAFSELYGDFRQAPVVAADPGMEDPILAVRQDGVGRVAAFFACKRSGK